MTVVWWGGTGASPGGQTFPWARGAPRPPRRGAGLVRFTNHPACQPSGGKGCGSKADRDRFRGKLRVVPAGWPKIAGRAAARSHITTR
jgi:hypothetical protein